MPIHEKMLTNPELLDVNRLVGEMLDELITKKYGTAKMEFHVVAGKVRRVIFGVEQSVNFTSEGNNSTKV